MMENAFGEVTLTVTVVKGGFILNLPVMKTNESGANFAQYETSVVNSQRKVIQSLNECLKDFKLTQE